MHVDRLQEIETGSFAPNRWLFCPPSAIRVVNWNVNRGLKLQGIVDFLATANADLILLAGSRSECPAYPLPQHCSGVRPASEDELCVCA